MLVKMPRSVSDKWAMKAEWAVQNRHAFSDYTGQWAAWPQRFLVEPSTRKVVGVVLPLLDGAAPLSAAINPTTRGRLFPDWDSAMLLDVAINVLATFRWLHERGVVHGDGSATNVLVYRDGRVGLIDCDGAQFTTGGSTLTCGVTTADYCPPELQPKTPDELDAYVRTSAQDTFSAVVLVLQLLGAGGAHPYSGKWDKSDGSRPPATEKRIELNAWHGAQVGPAVGRVSAPTQSLPLDAYGPRLTELARRTFDDGWSSPERRPSLGEWIDAMKKIRRSLRQCAANGRHWYPLQGSVCPYCELKHRVGVDLMPRPARQGLRLKPSSGWATS